MTEGYDNSTGDEMSAGDSLAVVTASLLVIGDEILSGRTADKNINYLAKHCTAIGIRLQEVRVVSDQEDRIIEAVNVLRSQYDYLFTTGGIGPTHDDITAVSVAKAVGAELEENTEALELMKQRYPEKALTPSRRLMARVPVGGQLVKNSVSGAPGFMIENVIVMAGVPKIMEVMLDDATQYLRTGAKMLSASVVVEHPESSVAARLKLLEDRYETVSLGSYPYFKEGRVGTIVVLRSTDAVDLDAAVEGLKAGLLEEGKTFRDEESGS